MLPSWRHALLHLVARVYGPRNLEVSRRERLRLQEERQALLKQQAMIAYRVRAIEARIRVIGRTPTLEEGA